MLWRKSWLECRYRLLLCFTMTFSIVVLGVLQPPENFKLGLMAGAADAGERSFRLVFAMLAGMVAPVGALIMAGSGINTQTNWGMMHGFHPSMHFLLSLPVSREQLLRVRAAMGLGLTLCWLMATMAILVGATVASGGALSLGKVLATLPNLAVGTVTYYAMAVFFTSFLDEYWAGMVSLGIIGLFAGYAMADGPSGANTLAFMMSQGLAQGEAGAWLKAAVYLALSGGFYWATGRVVQNKEY